MNIQKVEGFMRIRELIDRLSLDGQLEASEYKYLLENYTQEDRAYLAEKAVKARQPFYKNNVYIRGLIEFTNYCKNDCYYCGIRRSNKNASRYRLTKEQILDCCGAGYELGYRTFVLQGGEDAYFNDDRMEEIIRAIKTQFPDCAITLSIGEKEYESYLRFFKAGADRYLLRHETANEEHYQMLHPKELSLKHRKECLRQLKEIGYQVGCGMMVGSPGQTTDCLVEDLIFMKELDPDMIGIGPFIPHHDTQFADKAQGSLELTLVLLSILRLMKPNVLLPATTALGTISPLGREMGMQAGANVLMPNLSPKDVRKKYLLYDNKICTGDEAAECRVCMEKRMTRIGHEIVVSRGDVAPNKKEGGN